MATSKRGNVVTAKTALTHIEGIETMLKGALCVVAQFDAGAEQLEKKLDNLEYVKATLVGIRDNGESGLKMGREAGFVPTRF